jgi:hypothetical protein
MRPPAVLTSRRQGHPCPLAPCRASARRPCWLYGSNAIPGHCCLAGPPPGGRTSGRPCSCAWWRAAGARANLRGSTAASSTVGLRGVARVPEPALLAERRQDAKRMRDRAEASIERAKGRMPVASVRRWDTGNPEPAAPTTQGASGEMARTAPSLRHPRRGQPGAVFRLKPFPAGSLTAPRRVLTVRDSPVAASAFPRTWGVPPGGVRSACLRRRITRSAR